MAGSYIAEAQRIWIRVWHTRIAKTYFLASPKSGVDGR
jgi:hypothetical protein